MLDKIKELCRSQGMSVSQLEEVLGFGNKAIYKWDKQTPGIDKVKKVADYFGVTVDYLLSEEMEFDEKEALLQQLFDNKGMRILFSATQGATEEDLVLAAQIIETLKNNRDK